MSLFFDQSGIPLSELADACEGQLFASDSGTVRGISIDSRRIASGDLFVAVKGERFDGHDFIRQAFESGASAVLAERIPENVLGNYILVEDTVNALGRFAAAYKKNLHPLTVGVTGSVGKTTVKQFIFSVLSRKYTTCKTEGNLNNQLGLPLSLLSLNRSHGAAVFELAMSGKGEIEYLSKLTAPDIGVITCIGTSHIEFLGSREGIRDAKMEIVKGMSPDGKLILNGDEPLLAGVNGAIYVSLENSVSDYYVSSIRPADGFTDFDIRTPEGMMTDVRIPAIGKHIVYDAAIAIAVGKLVGISEDEIRTGLLSYTTVEMRQNIRRHRGYTSIHDYYNASPESVKAALRVLKELKEQNGGRSVAVLGDMRELGAFSAQLHEEVGKTAAELGTDMLFTFGSEASHIADGAEKAGMSAGAIYRFTDLENVRSFAAAIANVLTENDTVLFKASRAVRMERITDFIDREF